VANVVGLDLSLTATGTAFYDATSHSVDVDTIKSSGAKDASLFDRSVRLQVLLDRIIRKATGAQIAVIEGPSFGQARQGGQHDRAGLWWLVVDKLIELGIIVVEVSPASRAKYATGKGNAAKDAVLAAVVRRYPTIPVADNNQADAVVLVAMGARWLGTPIDDGLPLLNVGGMTKVRWPLPQEADF